MSKNMAPWEVQYNGKYCIFFTPIPMIHACTYICVHIIVYKYISICIYLCIQTDVLHARLIIIITKGVTGV